MNKSVFYTLSTLIALTIFALLGYIIHLLQIHISTFLYISIAVIVGLGIISLLSPKFRKKFTYILCEKDWAEETVAFYNNIPALYRHSFWTLFGFINLAFLFYTINFMWGNKDWSAIRSAVDMKEGLAVGNFSAFWLQELLFESKVLPVINNLIAFAMLAIAAILLCIYWNIEKRTSLYVLTGLFFIITPYTMAWLYHARLILGIFSLPLLCLSALILSEKEQKSVFSNTLSIFFFLTALGTDIFSISFIFVAFLGKILIDVFFNNQTLRESFKHYSQTSANFTSALLTYILIVIILKETDILTSSEIASLLIIIQRIPEMFVLTFSQFFTPLPFMDMVYKVFCSLILLLGLFTIILKAEKIAISLKSLLLVFIILLITKFNFLISADHETLSSLILKDFYTLPLVYSLMFAILLKASGPYLKRITLLLVILATFMGFIRVTYAQKIWKFGFDAELKLAERILTKMERMPEFNVDHKYKFIQIGSVSIRPKYYIHKHKNSSYELLDAPYYETGNASAAYNFFYQTDFLSNDENISALLENEDLRNFVLNNARPWPAKESIFINNDYIIFVLDNKALVNIQNQVK